MDNWLVLAVHAIAVGAIVDAILPVLVEAIKSLVLYFL